MTTSVHPSSVIEPGAVLQEGVTVGPFCHVGPKVVLGAGTQLLSHVSVRGATTIGKNCILHPQAVLGGLPQVIGIEDHPDSRLEVGDGCVFREYTTAHSGMPKSGRPTKIGANCLFMVSSHVAHDCQVGSNVVMASSVVIGGHVKVADNVWFGGQVAVHQYTRIGRNAFIGGGAILVEDVIPFGAVVGNHAKLSGLNVVGLKRRGFSKANLHEIRSAYQAVFEGEGLFKDRLEAAAVTFADRPLAMELVDFVRDGGDRPICKPG
jgi:UDP-N-acetylglucosamine acyltransferase